MSTFLDLLLSLDPYQVSFFVSSGIFFILWILIIHQCCITKIKRKQRIIRLRNLIILATLSVALNVSIYTAVLRSNPLSLHHSKFRFSIFSAVLEVLVLMIGFHLFGVFQIGIIDDIYIPIGMIPPKWIGILFNTIKCLYFITILILYVMAYLFSDLMWIFRFYIILSSITFIQSLIAILILRRLLPLLPSDSKHPLRITLLVQFIICFVAAVSGCFAVEYIDDFILIQFDHTLLLLVMHSVFLIMVLTALLLWIYQSGKCCVLEKRTVCHYWGCAPFWVYWCGLCCTHNFGHHDRRGYKGKKNVDRKLPLIREAFDEEQSMEWGYGDQQSKDQRTGSKLTSTDNEYVINA